MCGASIFQVLSELSSVGGEEYLAVVDDVDAGGEAMGGGLGGYAHAAEVVDGVVGVGCGGEVADGCVYESYGDVDFMLGAEEVGVGGGDDASVALGVGSDFAASNSGSLK